MDRDRRPLDIPPEDRYGSRGQSYRPGGNRSPRADTYRARSPPRRYVAPRGRSRSPPPRTDTYRRRSPSPRGFRDAPARGGDTYRSRPRSPLPRGRDDPIARSPLPVRRDELPRDDLFRREPERRDYGRERDFREERGFRDERDYREERRDDRSYAARSPPRYRERSPLPLKRTREPSPMDSRGRRTPPPAKRERLISPAPRGRYDDYPPSRTNSPPRRGFSPRGEARSPAPRGVTRGYRRADSRSPLRRNDRALDPRDVNDWRRPPPRSPTPPRVRPTYDDYDERGRESVATSRRSSPPVHPSRISMQTPDDRSSRPVPRDPYNDRDPYSARSPPRRELSPLPPRDRDYDDRGYDRDDRVPPPREPYRGDDPPARAPPTGPSAGGYRAPSSSMAPPTGPAAAAAVPISAHARAPAAAPPSGPRGDMGPRGGFGGPRGRGGFGGDFAPRGRGGPGFGGPGFRGGRGGAPAPGGFGRGQSYEQDFSHQQQQGTPSGPRSSFSSQGPPPAFRQNGTAAAPTYPRTQRFAGNGAPSQEPPTGPRASSTSNSTAQQPYRRPTEPTIPTGPASSTTNNLPPTGPASSIARRRDSENNVHPSLRDLPKIVPGGQKASPVIDRSRLEKLGEETERLRKAIEERETKKRKVLRDWERMERESENAALRSQLAEESLRGFEGGEGVGGAF